MTKRGEREYLPTGELIAKKMMQDAGVTRHVVDQRAHYAGGKTIHAPEVRNVETLYILAHECGHAFHRHIARGGLKSAGLTWLREYQAERWAHEAFLRHGLSVPKRLTKGAKENVRMEMAGAWDFSPEQIAALPPAPFDAQRPP